MSAVLAVGGISRQSCLVQLNDHSLRLLTLPPWHHAGHFYAYRVMRQLDAPGAGWS